MTRHVRRIDVGGSTGPEPNEVRGLLEHGRATRTALPLAHTRVAAVVTKYDHLKQTVNARPIAGTRREAHTNVPIDPESATGLRTTGISDDPNDPTLGYLIFAEDGSGAPRDKNPRNQTRSAKHQPRPLCFQAGRLRANNDTASDRTNLLSLLGEINRINPGDTSEAGKRWAIIGRDLPNGNGQIVLVADDIATMTLDQLESELKAVGRDGDASGTNISATGILRSG